MEKSESFFKEYFDIKEKDIIKIHNKTQVEASKEYKKLDQELKNNLNTNYLIVHVFAGHGV